MAGSNEEKSAVPTISKFVDESKSCEKIQANGNSVSNGSPAEATEEIKKKSKKFSIKQKVALAMLAAADFMSFCSMSIMAPFYPKEAANKGMTESMAGFVFGYYALIVFVSSPIFGKVLPKMGVKFLFISGLLMSGICSVIFGTLDAIHDYNLFTCLSFIIRGFEALGASAYSTAAYVIIINIFPDNAGAVRGLLETFVGLGMSAGPGIGGILFAFGGFGLPFYVVGVIIIMLAPLNIILLPSARKCEIGTKSGSLTSLLKLPPVIMTCLIMTVVSMTWGFLDPTLEPHLRKYQLSPSKVGLVFLLLSATYGIFCPAWGWLCDKIENYWWLMTTGLFCNSLVLLFMGPSPILYFVKDSIWLNIVSLSALGVSVAMALMPTYQFVLDSALENGFPDTLGTHAVIAGLWSSIYSLGEVLGPILGGALMEKYDFPTTATTFSGFNLALAIIGTLFFLYRKRTLKNVDIACFIPVKQEEVKKEYYSNEISELVIEISVKNGVRIENIKTK